MQACDKHKSASIDKICELPVPSAICRVVEPARLIYLLLCACSDDDSPGCCAHMEGPSRMRERRWPLAASLPGRAQSNKQHHGR
jgi:hypothetical protein